ncbi:MAG: LacI family transcriptional regulator [Clostridia bacterium]|nr:LacI family transcriptional regulator [Clostridia bacterium]
MSVTIRDVAKAAGVSASTVSRVLNQKGVISEETCQRIYQAMRELKYVPNDMARSFANGSARTIAIVINVSDAQSFSNTFFNKTVFGIETAAHRMGYNLMITNSSAGSDGLASIERLIMSKKIDGIVFPVSLVRPDFLKTLEETRFPCVILGRPDMDGIDSNWVDIANEQAGAMAARYMLKQGYRRIAFLSNGAHEVFNQDRIAGYRKELLLAEKYENDLICHAESSLEEGKKAVTCLLSSQERPDAVICSDEKLALAAARTAKAMGVLVPEEFGVLCFDNTPVTELAEPGISSVDVDTFELGRLAADNLIRQIEKPDVGAWHMQLSTHIIERDSTKRNVRAKEVSD